MRIICLVFIAISMVTHSVTYSQEKPPKLNKCNYLTKNEREKLCKLFDEFWLGDTNNVKNFAIIRIVLSPKGTMKSYEVDTIIGSKNKIDRYVQILAKFKFEKRRCKNEIVLWITYTFIFNKGRGQLRE